MAHTIAATKRSPAPVASTTGISGEDARASSPPPPWMPTAPSAPTVTTGDARVSLLARNLVGRRPFVGWWTPRRHRPSLRGQLVEGSLLRRDDPAARAVAGNASATSSARSRYTRYSFGIAPSERIPSAPKSRASSTVDSRASSEQLGQRVPSVHVRREQPPEVVQARVDEDDPGRPRAERGRDPGAQSGR